MQPPVAVGLASLRGGGAQNIQRADGFCCVLGGRKRRKTKRKKGGSSFTHQWQSVFSGTTPTEKWMKKHGKAIAPLALLG